MKPQRKQSRKLGERLLSARFIPMPPRRPLAGPLEECELIELENWLNSPRDSSWWQFPRIPDWEAARRIRLLIEHARKMTQQPEELRWRIEQMEEERGYIERIAALEKNPTMQTLFGELYQGIELLISDLYASAGTQSKTPKSYPRR